MATEAGPGAGPRRAGGRAGALLALGAASGLAIAALELLAPARGREGELPAQAVASVNGTWIHREQFARAVAAVAADRRNELGDAERRRVLERLIEEELLVQRGLELGLARHDRRVRGDLVAALIDSIVSEAAEHEPTPREVEAFFASNRDYFTQPGRLRVRQVLVRTDGVRDAESAQARARSAAQRLQAGEAYAAVARELGERVLPELPDALLTPTKLREYLGPALASAAVALPLGGVSEPLRSAAGFHVLELLELEEARTPELAEIEAEVRAELRRRAGDRALRAYLDQLRGRAQVRVAERLP